MKVSLQILTITILAAVMFCGCNSTKKNTDKELTLTENEKDKAKLLKQIERKYEDPQAHFELGQLYQSDGLWAQAEQQYNTALGFDPAHRDAQAARVKVLLAMGDKEKSELLAEIYTNQASNTAAGSLKLGLAFQNERLDEYALACYQQALRLAPNSAKINRQIGYYYLSKEDKVKGQDYLSRSFQLNPNQPDVARQLGQLGVAVTIPRKVEKRTGKLDKIVDESDKDLEK